MLNAFWPMTSFNEIVLAATFIGGAEIFTLRKLQSAAWSGHLVVNPSLYKLLRKASDWKELEQDAALEPLAEKISRASLRLALASRRSSLLAGKCLLGNLRAASLFAVAPAQLSIGNAAFIHDNAAYLNAKARLLIGAITARAGSTFFACQHARSANIIAPLVKSRTSVIYFDELKTDVRRRLSVADRISIAAVGRIERAKGQLHVAAIANELKRHLGRVELTLLGNVQEPDYLASIRSVLHPDVELRQITLRPDDVAALLEQMDAVVHASQRESLPLIMFESFRAGTPFFATPVGGITELLRPPYLLSGAAVADAQAILAFFKGATS